MKHPITLLLLAACNAALAPREVLKTDPSSAIPGLSFDTKGEQLIKAFAGSSAHYFK